MRKIFISLMAFCFAVNLYSEDFTRFQISADGGYSYRIGSIEPEVTGFARQHVNKLRSGFHLNGDASFYFNRLVGVGAKCSFSKYSNDQYIDILGINSRILVREDISLGYVGPCVAFRFMKNNHLFVADASLGFMWYWDDARISSNLWSIVGYSFGQYIGCGYFYSLTKNISIGAKFSFYMGLLTSYEVGLNDYFVEEVHLDSDEYGNLSRLDFSVGIKVNLW